MYLYKLPAREAFHNSKDPSLIAGLHQDVLSVVFPPVLALMLVPKPQKDVFLNDFIWFNDEKQLLICCTIERSVICNGSLASILPTQKLSWARFSSFVFSTMF